jgi:predicted dehydrogenase
VPELVRALGGRVGLVGYMMRFHPCLARIEDLVKSRLLGKPLWAKLEAGSYVPSWHPYENYAELYAVRRGMGGGVVLTESHELDLAAWFFGVPRAVHATGGKLSAHAGDAEDTASILLDCGFPVHVNLCFMQRPASRSIAIALEHGKIEWGGGAVLRVFSTDKNAWAEFTAQGHERDHLFRDEMNHFLACVRGEAKALIPIEEGAKSLDIAARALSQIWR